VLVVMLVMNSHHPIEDSDAHLSAVVYQASTCASVDGGDGGASACRELLDEDGRATLIAACGTPLWVVSCPSTFASRLRWCSLFCGLHS